MGYRYYVERLMRSGHLPNAEARTIRHQFHQAHTEVQEWLKLAATVMATRLHNVGLVTAPRSSDVRLRHLEVIGIQHTVALLIVVLQDGTVLQEMLTLAEPYSQEQLSALSDRLTRDLRGMTAGQILQRIPTLPSPDSSIATMVEHLLRRGEEQHTQVYHAGLADMIKQPEFLRPRTGETLQSTNERLRKMVEFLHQGIAVERFLSGLANAHDVQVVIGSDTAEELQDYSFVLGRYGDDAESIGFLGVIGPTRMEYPRAVALVRYMSTLMTDLMQAY
jgi:heat-inducible transcriptional repressor